MSTDRSRTPLAMDTEASVAPKESSRPNRIDRFLARKLLELSGSPNIAIELWDNSVFCEPNKEPLATIKIKVRKALYRLIYGAEVGFGDALADGMIEIEGDWVELLCEVFNSKRRAKQQKSSVLRIIEAATKKRARANTLSGSKSNIHHHYDLGNEFYSIWLDREAMQYTCAYFPRDDLSIEQAQTAKMEHVCRKLMLKPGQTVVEAGCGWGGLALYMAKNYDVNVKSYNISHEQIVYAEQRARAENLSHKVQYIEDDYRNITGTYDVFVSIGMLEHVGKDNYSELGAVIDRCLSDEGYAMIHSIGRNVPELMSAWIEKRIFPGAYPPSIREMMKITEPYNFSVLDIENLRLHYAETLRHWLSRFDENQQTVTHMFDERFVRAWRLYLSGSYSRVFNWIVAAVSNADYKREK